jgi:hypothetical protein
MKKYDFKLSKRPNDEKLEIIIHTDGGINEGKS